MGGKGSGRLSKEAKIVRSVLGKPETPVANSQGVGGLFIPNHSGDHSAGQVLETPSGDYDIANKKYVDDNSFSDFGSDNEIPFVNSAGDGFDYFSGFNFNGTNALTIDGGGLVDSIINLNASTDWAIKSKATNGFQIYDVTNSKNKIDIGAGTGDITFDGKLVCDDGFDFSNGASKEFTWDGDNLYIEPQITATNNDGFTIQNLNIDTSDAQVGYVNLLFVYGFIKGADSSTRTSSALYQRLDYRANNYTGDATQGSGFTSSGFYDMYVVPSGVNSINGGHVFSAGRFDMNLSVESGDPTIGHACAVRTYIRGNSAQNGGTVTNTYGILQDGHGFNDTTFTNMYHIYQDAIGNTDATITNFASIWTEKQTVATNNYGYVLDGDGSGADIVFGAGQDSSISYDGTDLDIQSSLVGSGTIKFNSTNNWTANGAGAVTISNVAPAGVGTATISKWFTIKDNTGTTYYIPAWT